MSQGEMFYLAMVVAAFATFMVVLAAVSWDEQRRHK